MYGVSLYVNSKIVANTTYQWYGDTGKSNDERTQGYFTGIGIVDIPSSESVELKFKLWNASGWNAAPCAYVMAEFFM